ncbi:conserved exported hypothetical protein [Sulfurovum sp. enrichment culture clone C5]|uniref:Uncharacterized protein n=1 Tax=Sulfurovum sp. enrichment culture clone C5 TaxID=497650 RepID=A0A0S4XNF2_9BACT|nr:conserved exported hypothetical protein [Sulfurovum sp. enrichment culture clone C5]
MAVQLMNKQLLQMHLLVLRIMILTITMAIIMAQIGIQAIDKVLKMDVIPNKVLTEKIHINTIIIIAIEMVGMLATINVGQIIITTITIIKMVIQMDVGLEDMLGLKKMHINTDITQVIEVAGIKAIVTADIKQIR